VLMRPRQSSRDRDALLSRETTRETPWQPTMGTLLRVCHHVQDAAARSAVLPLLLLLL
jgi:hypothetical protein